MLRGVRSKAVSRIRYSFVIPVFNERETLPELHQRLSHVIDGLDGQAELLFVDDCSYDGSYELLAELGRARPARPSPPLREKLRSPDRDHGGPRPCRG